MAKRIAEIIKKQLQEILRELQKNLENNKITEEEFKVRADEILDKILEIDKILKDN